MQTHFRLQLKFWGVRGSIPTPQIKKLGYGGNTSCIEVRSPDNEILIFDGGTGIRSFGRSLLEEFKDSRLSIQLFLTHFHWDHIQGIPFFTPLYKAENQIDFHSFLSSAGLEEMLEGQMKKPYFPIDFKFLQAKREFREFTGKPIQHGRLTIHPFPLNHPQGACGYRVESGGAVIVYASDLEHGHAELDRVLREYSQNADVLIYDAQYTPEEYETHRGWGHSTWLEATRVARDANVNQLVLFHHDPAHDDAMLFKIVEEARLEFENTLGAKEGLAMRL